MGPLCLGLHVTKCAGTSLITTLRRLLSEDEYYFFSSYHEGWLTGHLGFADLIARERLRIVFGHYCDETLLSVFADRPVFLFTGLREPVACAVSRYRHVNAVRARAGREPISADAYFDAHANPMSVEILRGFPSLAAQPGALWQRARAALSLFDFIYVTERFSTDATVVFDVLGVPDGRAVRDNVSDTRALTEDTRAFVAAECETIRANDREYLGEDMRLWEAMRPFLSRAWARVAFAGEKWAVDRDSFTRGLPAPAEALRAFGVREHDFLVQEFSEIGRLEELRASLETRIAASRDILSRINGDGAHFLA